MTTITELKKLKALRDKLLAEQQDRIHNRLDYMRWDLYKEQNDMREKILQRIRDKVGPNIFVVFGGNRSGKSELGGGIMATVFKTFKKMRMWCATVSDLAIKVQQRKLFEMIRKKDISYGDYNEIRGWKNNTIISKLRSVIYCKTYEQGAGAFQGDDIDVAWFDEECPYDVFSETLVRLTDRNGIIVLTFTSLMGFTRIVNRLWETNDPDVTVTVLTPAMNPFLSAAAKAQLKSNLDPDDIQSRWEGKPHLKEGLIYKEFGDIHKIKRFDYKHLVRTDPRRWKLFEGIDPHDRTPHHWCRFLYDMVNDDLYIVEELKAFREAMLVSDFSRLIRAKRGTQHRSDKLSIPDWCQIDTSSMKPDIINRPEGVEVDNYHSVYLEFIKNGIDVVVVQKDNAVGIDAVKSRLKVVRAPATGIIKRRPKIYVFDDCGGVIWEFGRYCWDSYISDKITERREMVNTPKKKDDHYMDIVKYVCIRLKMEVGWDDKVDDVDMEYMHEDDFDVSK